MLVTNPFHYKIYVPRSRIHKACFFGYFVILTEHATAFSFLRKNAFIEHVYICYFINLLHEYASMLIATVNIVLMASVMFIGYIILTVKLKQTQSNIKTAQSDSINSKVTKVCWMMVTAWIIFNVPVIIISQVITFVPFSKSMGVVYEVSYLVFCLNNISNPILYFITMRDFREGYKSLLLCRKLANKTERVNTISRTGSTLVGSVNKGVEDSGKQSK